ncbi:MAG: CapA family protein [Kofleriaceae bacterium]|nr:CapA family protein [Kofleriaceae bacterium]
MRTRWTVAALALASFSLAACATDEDELSLDDEEGDDYDPFSPKADGNSGLGGPVSFAARCEPGARTTIAAVGDVLLHGPLQKQAVAKATSGRFTTLWKPIEDLLAQADTTYANFEGPSASGVNAAGRSVTDPGFKFDQVVYASYPQFNYHAYLPVDLKATGFDVVSTANNHSLDRRQLGADRTVESLREAGMPFTGTKSRDDLSAPWHTFTNNNGFKLAWLACTYGTNGLPDPSNQVLGCWEDEATVKEEIRKLKAMPGVDAVIVTPHWGVEYSANPSRDQRQLAYRFLEAGATMVLGSHPHVLQPWEKYKTADGREAFIIYSLGNFVSNQSQLARRSTLLLYVGLTRTASGVKINGVRYVPMIMNRRNGTMAVEAIDRAGGSADSRRMTVAMFGSENIQDPSKPLEMTPGCAD